MDGADRDGEDVGGDAGGGAGDGCCSARLSLPRRPVIARHCDGRCEQIAGRR